MEQDFTSEDFVSGRIYTVTPRDIGLERTENRVSRFRNTPFEVGLYSTSSLVDRNGRIPEQVVTDKLIGSFRDNRRDLRIVRDLPTVDIGDVGSGCSGGGIDLFLDYINSGDAPFVAADSNLLLMDTEFGGCGAIGGNIGVAPARHITERRRDVTVGQDGWARNTSACMHEIGHNMGWGHCGTENESVHPGIAETDFRRNLWIKTPETACDGVDNLCGESIPVREFDQVENLLYYNDCAFEKMKIVDKPLLEPVEQDTRSNQTLGLLILGGLVAAWLYEQQK